MCDHSHSSETHLFMFLLLQLGKEWFKWFHFRAYLRRFPISVLKQSHLILQSKTFYSQVWVGGPCAHHHSLTRHWKKLFRKLPQLLVSFYIPLLAPNTFCLCFFLQHYFKWLSPTAVSCSNCCAWWWNLMTWASCQRTESYLILANKLQRSHIFNKDSGYFISRPSWQK